MSEETLPGAELQARGEGGGRVLQQMCRQQTGGAPSNEEAGAHQGGQAEETKKGETETDPQPHQSAQTEARGQHILGWRRRGGQVRCEMSHGQRTEHLKEGDMNSTN